MTTLSLTLEEIKEIGALTEVAHLFVRQKDVARLNQCLGAGVKFHSTHDGVSLVAAALRSKDDTVIDALWAHSLGDFLKAKDVWETAVDARQKKWFECMLKALPEGDLKKHRTRFSKALQSWMSDKGVWAADAVYERMGSHFFPEDVTHELIAAIQSKGAVHWVSKLRDHQTKMWKEGSTEFLKVKIDQGSKRNKEGWVSPLTVALKTNQILVAEQLIQSGYPVRPRYLPYEECSEVLMALEYGVSDEGIRFLLNHGCPAILTKEANWNWNPDLTAEEAQQEFEKAKEEYEEECRQMNIQNHRMFPEMGRVEFRAPFWDAALGRAFELERFDLVPDLVKAGCSVDRLYYVAKELGAVSPENTAKWERLFLMGRVNSRLREVTSKPDAL
jgi:hypothetical protein